MSDKIKIPPPTQYNQYSPSQLFRYFFQIGHWTEESFSSELQNYTRGTLISVVSINKWKNQDVIPTRYSGPLFKLIESLFDPAVSKNWIEAFEIVWATYLARPEIKEFQRDHLNFSDSICEQHSHWIASYYRETLFGETFSAHEIYVPLELISLQNETPIIFDADSLLNRLQSNKASSETSTWTFITGKHGSGKSMLARHIADQLTKTDIMPIYIRGSHLSDVDIDIQNDSQMVIDSFSPKSFIKHFRASSKKIACLIIDGLDDISTAPTGETHQLNKIFKEMFLEQEICRAHSKKLHVIMLGQHQTLTVFNQSHATQDTVVLETLGLDGNCNSSPSDSHSVSGKDMRENWWNSYLTAKGYSPDGTYPDFLWADYDEFHDFGSNPLLAHLICDLALNAKEAAENLSPYESVNSLTYSKNKSLVYQEILNQLCLQSSQQAAVNMNSSEVLSLLQKMALTHWHSGQDTFPMEQLEKIIENPKSLPRLQTLSIRKATSTSDPIQLLTSAFFYQIMEDKKKGHSNLIKVTNPAFSEYLVSTLMVDCFIKLITAFHDQNNFEYALQNWSHVTQSGAHTPSLADFCQKAVKLKYDSLSGFDTALVIIQRHLKTKHFSKNGMEALSNIKNSSGMLFFIWACFNIERQKRTGFQYELTSHEKEFDINFLREINQVNIPDSETGSLLDPYPNHLSFITPGLSALKLHSEDLSHFNFCEGNLQEFLCEKTSFALTLWNQVKISKSKFVKSTFQQAFFRQCSWIEAQIYSCIFQGSNIQKSSFAKCDLSDVFFTQCHITDVDFTSTKFERVIFDRCIFTNCRFSSSKKKTPIRGISFRYSTFLQQESSLSNLSKTSFENCLIDPPNSTEIYTERTESDIYLH